MVFRHGYGISSFDATGGSLCNTGAQDTLAGGSAKAEMFTTLTIVGDTDKSVSVHLYNQRAFRISTLGSTSSQCCVSPPRPDSSR